jgi:hypothetical protein
VWAIGADRCIGTATASSTPYANGEGGTRARPLASEGAVRLPTHPVMGSRQWRRRLLGIAAALALVAAGAALVAVPFLVRDDEGGGGSGGAPATHASPPPAPPGTPMRRLVLPARGGYLGVSSLHLVDRPGALRAWIAAQGVRPAIVNWFQQWRSGELRFRPDWAERAAALGAVPMITWEPWYAPPGERRVAEQPDVALARIAEGAFDDLVTSWAEDVAAYRGPVLIRLMHEMNGFWYPWGVEVNGNTPRDYVRAWRRVHRIFARAGARNVSWVWSVNNVEEPGEDSRISRYYPGDRYVDWVATSGFNWGTAFEWSSWRDADALLGSTYRALQRFGKPIMISELGTTGLGGDPALWIAQTMRRIRTDYPGVRAVVWYDDIDGSNLDFRLRGATAGALRAPGGLARGWARPPRARVVGPPA